MGQTNDKPSKSRARNGGKPHAERFNGARFVQYELDSVEALACKGWSLDGDAAWQAMLPLLDEGYSFTVKYDGYSQCYACFVQIRGDENHPNSGLILTGRGSTPHKAVKQALYKHQAIDASWVQYGERRTTELDD